MLCLCYRWIFKTNTVRVTVREGNTELPDDSLIIFGYDVSGRVTSEEEAVSGVTFVLFGVSVFFFTFLIIFQLINYLSNKLFLFRRTV